MLKPGYLAYYFEAAQEALLRFGPLLIFNTDQGCQFTAKNFTHVLLERGVKVSRDGKGRWTDNVFVERLWRTLKYKQVYLNAYDTLREARAGIGRHIELFNSARPHSALGMQTPASFYDGELKEAA